MLCLMVGLDTDRGYRVFIDKEVAAVRKAKEKELLHLLQEVYHLDTTKKDEKFSQLILSTVYKIENGKNASIECVRLIPFLNQYLLSAPSKELVDLQTFLQRESNFYRGWISFFRWF